MIERFPPINNTTRPPSPRSDDEEGIWGPHIQPSLDHKQDGTTAKSISRNEINKMSTRTSTLSRLTSKNSNNSTSSTSSEPVSQCAHIRPFIPNTDEWRWQCCVCRMNNNGGGAKSYGHCDHCDRHRRCRRCKIQWGDGSRSELEEQVERKQMNVKKENRRFSSDEEVTTDWMQSLRKKET